MRLRCFLIASIFLVAAFSHAAAGFTFRVDGDRLFFHGKRVPLHDVLDRLVKSDVRIRIDPNLNPMVSGSFEGEPLEDSLRAVLRPLNHVFIWTRENGRIRLSELRIFEQGRQTMMKPYKGRTLPTSSLETNSIKLVGPAREKTTIHRTPVLFQNNNIYVPVTLGHDGIEIDTHMALDTGAGTTVIYGDVAGRLGLNETTPFKGQAVGGIPIDGGMAQIDFIRVGPHQKENLKAAVIAFEGERPKYYDGLLGMNFLKGLSYTLDTDRSEIRWKSVE